MDDSVVNRDVSCQLSKQGSADSKEEIDSDAYYGDLWTFVMANFPPVPNINMADYQVDSDKEDVSIKDSTGTTVAVIVQSKMRRLSAEKTRAAIASFPVFDAHDVRDDDIDKYIPILGMKGSITGMGYTRNDKKFQPKMVNLSRPDMFGRTS